MTETIYPTSIIRYGKVFIIKISIGEIIVVEGKDDEGDSSPCEICAFRRYLNEMKMEGYRWISCMTPNSRLVCLPGSGSDGPSYFIKSNLSLFLAKKILKMGFIQNFTVGIVI